MRLQLIRAQTMGRHRAMQTSDLDRTACVAAADWDLRIACAGALFMRADRLKPSTELAGYTNSTHVDGITDGRGIGADAESGVSVSGRYLVDVVSAASVDIVATASRAGMKCVVMWAFKASVQRGPATSMALLASRGSQTICR